MKAAWLPCLAAAVAVAALAPLAGAVPQQVLVAAGCEASGKPIWARIEFALGSQLSSPSAASPVHRLGIAETFGQGAHKANEPGLKPPVLKRSVTPEFPYAAFDRRMTGTVYVDAVVLVDGTIGEIRITRSLDPYRGLDAAALSAARQWRFQPATLEGKPVPTIIQLELAFNFDGPRIR